MVKMTRSEMMAKERKETKAQERKESHSYQRREEKMGVEKHGKGRKCK